MGADPVSRADAVLDAALDVLVQGRRGLNAHATCPGCDLLVHREDESEHATACAPLRTLAEGAVDA